jgi:hypothetical protein
VWFGIVPSSGEVAFIILLFDFISPAVLQTTPRSCEETSLVRAQRPRQGKYRPLLVDLLYYTCIKGFHNLYNMSGRTS